MAKPESRLAALRNAARGSPSLLAPNDKSKKIFLFVFACTTCAVCLWYVASHFQWAAIRSTLREVSFMKLTGMLLAAHFAYIFMRAWRWNIAVARISPATSFVRTYVITAIAAGVANYTPGQMGEALKVEILKQQGRTDRLPLLGVFAIERVLDLAVIAAMGLIGLTLNRDFMQQHPRALPGLAAVLVLTMSGLGCLRASGHGGRLFHWMEPLYMGIGTIGTWTKMAAVTACSWAIVTVAWKLCLTAAGADVSWAQLILVLPVVTLGSILSLIPGGLGVSEVMVASILVPMGVPAATAQAGALVLRLYGITTLFVGLAHLVALAVYRTLLSRQNSPRASAVDHRRHEPTV
jgi:uncharacterized membrane protein YbhN (UPF0104 family)